MIAAGVGRGTRKPKVSRTQIVLLALLILTAGLLAALAMRNRQPPILPADEDHAVFTTAEDCLVCHGSDGGSPQSRNHPIGPDCLRCHGRP
jgi:cytochrome c553